MPSLISTESTKLIGESLGVVARDEVATKLAEDTEFRTREVIQEAAKFMRHAKRTRLTPADVNNALRTLNVEPLYGYSGTDPDRLRFGHAASSNVYYTSDKEIPLSEVIHMELPQCPLEPALQCHWLAVEGLQPICVQNPPLDSELNGSKSKKRKMVGEDNVQVNTKVRHVLSKELQLFFKQIVNAVKAPGSDLHGHVLETLSKEAGFNQLLPYISQLVADEVRKNLKELPLLFSLMQLVQAVLANRANLHVEPYLHQLMPPILTCLVGKSLCHKPSEDHWSLRDMAAETIRIVVNRFGNAYPSLKPRITRTLIHALLDPLKPLTTHYGAIMGLTALGPDAIRTLLLPNLIFYTKLLVPEMTPVGTPKALEASRCFAALSSSLGVLMHNQPFTQPAAEGVDWAEIAELFGESLRPFTERTSSERPGLCGGFL